VEGNEGSLKDGAEAFVLFLRGAQLILRSSVLTVLDLDEMDVSLENAEIFGSVMSGEGGSVGGGWRCCRSAPGLPQQVPSSYPCCSYPTNHHDHYFHGLRHGCCCGGGGAASSWGFRLGSPSGGGHPRRSSSR